MQRFSPIERALTIRWTPNPLTGSAAVFLWGARQTGKTTYLKRTFPDALTFDLLDTTLAAELSVRPAVLRERVLADRPALVVVDEVQHVPALLTEVHWLLENTPTRFVLCGSSARKLRREARNLMGGRATDQHMLPLTSLELGRVDLPHLLRVGALPSHYLVADPTPLLRAYVNNYLKAEIIDESVTRNVPAFSRFLKVVGLTCGQQLNHSNIARESGVSAATVRNYFQILADTLLGFTLEPWRGRQKRRLVETSKFYLFDVGVANQLHPDGAAVTEGSDRFGRAFEHFILNEVRAYLEYRWRDQKLSYWRTSSGFEVDLVIGDMDVVVECKSAREIRTSDLKGLRALADEHTVRRRLVVSRIAEPRTTDDGIELVPWERFCAELWADQLF